MLALLTNVRVLFGAVIITGAAAIIASGATGAFFSDTETSTNNTFAAGALDLKIDNDSYYNGNRCINVGTSVPDWRWQGNALYPIPGTPCTTSFPQVDLDAGYVFFDFDDIKPDDEGEDTISIHVQNDAWACMDLTLTSNDDTSTTEPESDVDEDEDLNDAWDGELASVLEFFWWADDGDNVYEEGEQALSNGVQSLLDLAPQNDSFSVVLADAQNNAWGLPDGTPLPANETVYIAKAWCLGDLTLDPVLGNGGVNPSVDPGVNCNGTLLGNETQTDGVELTIAFRAEQARNNGAFLCNPPVEEKPATLTVNKALLVSTIGIEVADFQLTIDGPGAPIIVTDEVPQANLPAGAYVVTELVVGDVAGKTFTVTFSGACAADGTVTLNPGDNVTCNILNNENGDGIGD